MKKWYWLLLIFIFSFFTGFAQDEISQDDEWDNYVYAFADTILQCINSNQPDFINEYFEREEFIQKIIIEKEDAAIQKFNATYRKDLDAQFDFGRMMTNIGNDKYYDFVNQYTSVDGDVHLIYRMMHKDGAFNYHNFELQWRDSSLKIIDMYVYMSGENISETFHLLYKNLLRAHLENNGGFDVKRKPTGNFVLIKELMAENKNEEAMNNFLQFPEKYRKQKAYRIWKIKIAKEIGGDAYRAAIAEFIEEFPNDPSFYMMVYTKALLDEDYTMALKYLNKIDISIGLDPFLEFYRGNIYFLQKNYSVAQKKYEKIDKRYKFGVLDDQLFELYLASKNYPKVVEILQRYVNDYEYTKPQIMEWLKTDHAQLFTVPEILEWEKDEKP